MDLIPNNEVNYKELRDKLIDVVKHEVGLCSAPFGLFLSGGVDSSLIAGIVAKLVRDGEIDLKKRGMRKLHSFTIGLKGSPDLHYAQQVAKFLGTEHHAFTYTVEEGID
jgi:asparagine synthase (glutamine-hydrolysing)